MVWELAIIESEVTFQASLILSNSPQTPKIVNASFMAFSQDFDDLAYGFARELTHRSYEQSHLPLIPRRKTRIKGYSVDYLNNNDDGDADDDGTVTKGKLERCILERSDDQLDKECLVKSSTGNVLNDLFRLKSIKQNGQNGCCSARASNELTINCSKVNEKFSELDEEEEKKKTKMSPFYANLDFIRNSTFGKLVFNKQSSLDSKIQGFYEKECSQDAAKPSTTDSSTKPK